MKVRHPLSMIPIAVCCHLTEHIFFVNCREKRRRYRQIAVESSSKMPGAPARQIKSIFQLGKSSTTKWANRVRRTRRILSHGNLWHHSEPMRAHSNRIPRPRPQFHCWSQQEEIGCKKDGVGRNTTPTERRCRRKECSIATTKAILSEAIESSAVAAWKATATATLEANEWLKGECVRENMHYKRIKTTTTYV